MVILCLGVLKRFIFLATPILLQFQISSKGIESLPQIQFLSNQYLCNLMM